MGAAKRQGREKFTKIEQRKVKGRSEDWSEDLRWNKQHPRLARFPQGRPGEEENIQKEERRAGALSCTLAHSPTRFPSCLWVGMPSRLKDGFSCSFLNKIEL